MTTTINPLSQLLVYPPLLLSRVSKNYRADSAVPRELRVRVLNWLLKNYSVPIEIKLRFSVGLAIHAIARAAGV